MKLELDFTNKVIVVVGKGTVKEFMEIINTPNFEDWDIDVVQYVPSYPHYPTYPTYETTVASTTVDCGCSDKCKGE